MARRKRVNPRRLEGKRILDLVPRFGLECGDEKSVTAARKFIEAHSIQPPAIVVVQRSERNQERFFWGFKGLFSAQYVEEHHFMFPSLEMLRVRLTAEAQGDSVA
ncbi:DUF3155 domain-containing protein [Gloeobacter kilaueensis]|uniref:Uncharacterized protein n=1 Tax=Gloeobacter kilaueensis (strain ATCC BAA-2537 / CCAP 1431/1 / ULC 316 / JS1) TaxID=1183438 RepID=U5QPD0_GLOK1|nr:DUF3155 domain-containing protein [Gloeobacter kilaueensis]AGY59449.1 hypothetical protein GKIL_3203 [Gloeobacter kilaueensis JS1]